MATSHMIGPLRVGALQGNDSAVVLGVGTAEFFSSIRLSRTSANVFGALTVVSTGTTSILGPLSVGSGPQVGRVVQSQETSYGFTGLSAESFSIARLPASAQILDVLIDVVTAWDPATSTLSVGDSSASSLYIGSGSQVDLNSAGRVPGSGQRFNGANVGSMYQIGSARSVMGFILNSTAPTQGSLRVTLIYVQR